MAYCHWCHRWASLGAAAMCDVCRREWQPAVISGDLGLRTQPQSSGGG